MLKSSSFHEPCRSGKPRTVRFFFLTVIFIYTLYLAVMFAPKLMEGVVLAFEDGKVQNYPAFAAAGRFWTPYLFCGFPVLADPQVATFYPLMQISRLLPGGFNIYVLGAYLLAMTGAALLSYRLCRSKFGALVAGVVYGGSGFFLSELNHVQILHTAAWLPYLLLMIDRLKQHLSPARPRLLCTAAEQPGKATPLFLEFLALALLVSLVIFAGHPQTAFYGLLFSLAYIFVDNGLINRVKFLSVNLPLLLCLALGVLVASVQILPSYELAKFSARPFFNYSDFLVGQLGWSDLLGFVFPYILGGQYGTIQGLAPINQGPPLGYFFFGFAPLLLALGVLMRRFREPQIRFFAIAGFLAFLLVLGSATPLAYLVYQLPVFGSFRGLYRLLMVPVLSVAILTGFAISRIESLAVRPGSGGRALSFEQLWRGRGLRKHLYLMTYLTLSGLSLNFFLGTMPLFLYLQAPLARFRKILLFFSICICLVVYGLHADWHNNCHKASEFEAPPEVAGLRDELAREHVRIFSIKGLEGGSHELPANICRLWGIANASGYSPLVPWPYARLIGIAEGGFLKPPWVLRAENRAFDIASVKYVLAPEVEVPPQFVDSENRDNWTMKKSESGVIYFENRRVMSRFRLVDEAISLEMRDALRSCRTSLLPGGRVFHPERSVIITTGEASLPLEKNTRITGRSIIAELLAPYKPAAGTVQLLFESESSIDLQVDAIRPAYLVIADQYYPGWQATIDGLPVEIQRANCAFRAIAVPSGAHRVSMKFRSQSVSQGMYLSLVGLFLLCVFVWSYSRKTSKLR